MIYHLVFQEKKTAMYGESVLEEPCLQRKHTFLHGEKRKLAGQD